MSVISFIPKHHRFKLTSLQQNQVLRFITRSLEKETPVTFCMTIHALIINLFFKYMSKMLEPWGLILVTHASNDNSQSMLIKTFVYRRSFLYEITFLDINIKKWVSTTIESGPQYINILQSFVFSREHYMITSVLSVLSCNITCIAHKFHINGI